MMFVKEVKIQLVLDIRDLKQLKPDRFEKN